MEHMTGDITSAEPDPVMLANAMASLFFEDFGRSGEEFDLSLAFYWCSNALSKAGEDHPERGLCLFNVSRVFRGRYSLHSSVADLDKAGKYAKEAVLATPLSHPEHACRVCHLAVLLLMTYDRLGMEHCVPEAINLLSFESTLPTTAQDVDIAGIWDTLATANFEMYNITGDHEFLNQSIASSREALEKCPVDIGGHAMILANFADRLEYRYSLLGDKADIDEAISKTAEAKQTMPNAYCLDRGPLLNSESNHYHARWERTGNLEDLREAIRLAEQLVSETPANHPKRAARLGNLARKLSSLSDAIDEFEIMDTVIKLAKAALECIQTDYQQRILHFLNLSQYLHAKYLWTDDWQILLEAVDAARTGLDLSMQGSKPSVHCGVKLAELLQYVGERSRDVDSIEEAKKLYIFLLESSSAEDPLRGKYRVGLAIAFGMMFDLGGKEADLLRAIEEAEKALSEPHLGELTAILVSIGRLYKRRYERTALQDDLHTAVQAFTQAWDTPHGYMPLRVQAASEAADLLFGEGKWLESSALLTEAVKLLPLVSPRSSAWEAQQYLLGLNVNLAAKAAAAALQAGKSPAEALAMLELGRNIILGNKIDIKGDFSNLRLINKQLCVDFDNLRSRVDRLNSNLKTFKFDTIDGHASLIDNWRLRVEADEQLESILRTIRQIPKFEGFLLPPSESEFVEISEQGPIVVFNSTAFRSDAFIIANSTIKTLNLPQLTYHELSEHVEDYSRTIRGVRLRNISERNKKLQAHLSWLWDVAVGPVCYALGLEAKIKADADGLPRIWLIGVGLMSRLPLHAAGRYADGSTDNLYSRAISSYTPTVKALKFAREGQAKCLSPSELRLLIVTMPKTPGAADLNGVSREAQGILTTKDLPAHFLRTHLDQPCANDILDKLEIGEGEFWHFACHGVSDPENPAKSRLLLRAKSESGEQEEVDILTVQALSQARIGRRAILSYLSACSTAEVPNEKLQDESLYIASGFLLTGFSHVVASLWVANDEACAVAAMEFYRQLFDKNGQTNDRQIATAWHISVQHLYERFPNQPLKWAAFVHLGA